MCGFIVIAAISIMFIDGCAAYCNSGIRDSTYAKPVYWPGTPAQKRNALPFLGSPCNSATAVGCNPYQLPLWNHDSKVYTPVTPLVVQSENNVCVDETPSYAKEVSVQLSKHSTSQSHTDSSSFGMDISLPYLGLTFSLGPQHNEMTKTMTSSSESFYYAEMRQNVVVYTTVLENGTSKVPGLVLDPQFQADVSRLPQNATSDRDKAAWFSFFDTYGTHFVNTVSFGGMLNCNVFINSEVETTSSFTDDEISWYLGAYFTNHSGGKIKWDQKHTQQRFSEFQQYTSQDNWYAFGGSSAIAAEWANGNDPTSAARWVASVRENTLAPIQTTLLPLQALFADAQAYVKDYAGAVEAYFLACPHTDDNGICNGFGSCTVMTPTPTPSPAPPPYLGTCTCDSPGYIIDEDTGNCYPVCKDDCNIASGQGMECIKGVCFCAQFNSSSDIFGFTGTSCEQGCGKFDINIGFTDQTPIVLYTTIGQLFVHSDQLLSSDDNMEAQKYTCLESFNSESGAFDPYLVPFVDQLSVSEVWYIEDYCGEPDSSQTWSADGGRGTWQQRCETAHYVCLTGCDFASGWTCSFGNGNSCPPQTHQEGGVLPPPRRLRGVHERNKRRTSAGINSSQTAGRPVHMRSVGKSAKTV
jgi:hypothetical protein